ncbi:hypothetical protein ID867_15210 [Streptomyces parvulus]|nr:hypothetical protein [Streptomyces parvulus]
MSDPLYQRYLDGLDAYRRHTCTPPECTNHSRCPRDSGCGTSSRERRTPT